MSNASKRTISLPQEYAAYIDSVVASGAFATASEVVRAGLSALQERDQALKRWLCEELGSAYDAMHADPDRDEAALPTIMSRSEAMCKMVHWR